MAESHKCSFPSLWTEHVSIARFWRRANQIQRNHLAIAVLPDAATAFQVYRLLQIQGVSPEHLALVGQGFCSPESVGLPDPMQIALRKAYRTAIAGGTLGSTMSFATLLVLHLGTGIALTGTLLLGIPAVGIMGGFSGAVVGALVGFLGEGNVVGLYRHHLRQGRYLLMVEGSERIVHLSRDLLRQYTTLRTY